MLCLYLEVASRKFPLKSCNEDLRGQYPWGGKYLGTRAKDTTPKHMPPGLRGSRQLPEGIGLLLREKTGITRVDLHSHSTPSRGAGFFPLYR